MSAKLIFSDIDGTLITSQGVVSSTTIEAIRKQIIDGNLFIPVSARFPKGIMNVVDKITNFCPIIAYNGALVLDEMGRPLNSQFFEASLALKLIKEIEALNTNDLAWNVYSGYNFLDLLFKTKKYRAEEKAAHQSAIDLLVSLDLGDQIDNYAKNLPYGMQRKLEIARAIATKARLVILDEPAAGMNPQESEELKEFIRKLRDKGQTILLIEHDMSVVMDISDRIYVIDHGRKIAEGLPKEIAVNKRVITAYLGSGDVKKDDNETENS